MSGLRTPDFENTYATGLGKPQAEIVAFNALSVGDGIKVFVTTSSSTVANAVKGQNSTVVAEGVRVLNDLTQNSAAAISGGSIDGASIGSTTASTGYFTEARVNGTRFHEVTLSGSGTVVSIPHISQGSNRRQILIRLSMIDNSSGGPAVGGTCEAKYRSLTNLDSLTQLSVSGDITSISASVLNLNINLGTTITNPIILIEMLGQGVIRDLVDVDNISIA